MVTKWEIKTNPKKIEVVQQIQPPCNVKEVQWLLGRITTLSRFISHSTDNLPIFKILKKARHFQWDEQCEKVFQELKEYLSELPILAKPWVSEKLWVYFATSEVDISTVLVWQEERK